MSLPKCPVCSTPAPSPFFELAGVPVYCNVLWPTRDAAVAAPRADVRLALCGSCGLIWNTSFDESVVEYGAEYENSLHYSPVFQEHVRELAERLVGEHGLAGAHVVDIGCGKGDFLALLCEGGRNRGSGFDPSYEGGHDDAPWLSFRRDVYRADGSAPRGDLVTARHVLEHVTEPARFAELLRTAVADGGTVYVEVPSGEYMLRSGAVWDVIYEHCTYFTAPALTRLLRAAGFEVVRSGECYGDQYLWIEATPATAALSAPAQTAPALEELSRLAERFAGTFASVVGGAERVLGDGGDRARVALWGAGSKGVTFLNVADRDHRVEAVFDVNPRKQGRHVAGSGQRVLAPAELAAAEPETVLVMNPLYTLEIEQLVRESGVGADVVLV
jgi:hypothetical protein